MKLRTNRELVPFKADSELWPYSSLQQTFAGVVGAAHQEEEQTCLSDLALPHYDTRDVLAITDLPYMVVSHDLGQCAIALSQLKDTQ